MSENLTDWSNATAELQLLSNRPNPDGTAVWKYFEKNPSTYAPARFFRLRVSGP
jgi:hypothetical protein